MMILINILKDFLTDYWSSPVKVLGTLLVGLAILAMYLIIKGE